MKNVRFYVLKEGELQEVFFDAALMLVWQDAQWRIHKSILKIDVFASDIKIGPLTIKKLNLYVEKKLDGDKGSIRTKNKRGIRKQKEARNDQGTLVRINKASTPYTEEYPTKADPRNRPYVPKTLRERRAKGQSPPTQN